MSETKKTKAPDVRRLMEFSKESVHSPDAYDLGLLICLFRGGRHEVVRVADVEKAQEDLKLISAQGGRPVGSVGWCGECGRLIGPPLPWLEGTAYRRAEACLENVREAMAAGMALERRMRRKG